MKWNKCEMKWNETNVKRNETKWNECETKWIQMKRNETKWNECETKWNKMKQNETNVKRMWNEMKKNETNVKGNETKWNEMKRMWNKMKRNETNVNTPPLNFFFIFGKTRPSFLHPPFDWGSNNQNIKRAIYSVGGFFRNVPNFKLLYLDIKQDYWRVTQSRFLPFSSPKPLKLRFSA